MAALCPRSTLWADTQVRPYFRLRCGTPYPASRYHNKSVLDVHIRGSDVPWAFGFVPEQRNCRSLTPCGISHIERGGVAQLVEQRTHKPRVRGSKPFTATIFPNTKSANPNGGRNRISYAAHQQTVPGTVSKKTTRPGGIATETDSVRRFIRRDDDEMWSLHLPGSLPRRSSLGGPGPFA